MRGEDPARRRGKHGRFTLSAKLGFGLAIFPPGRASPEARQAKKARIAAKPLLRHGLRLLDTGCGSLGLTPARGERCVVKGASVSGRQVTLARQRAGQESRPVC